LINLSGKGAGSEDFRAFHERALPAGQERLKTENPFPM